MLSPGNLFAINPVWSALIIVGRTLFILEAITPEAILYETFKREIGRQFFISFLHLSPFGIQTTKPSFCVADSSPISKP